MLLVSFVAMSVLMPSLVTSGLSCISNDWLTSLDTVTLQKVIEPIAQKTILPFFTADPVITTMVPKPMPASSAAAASAAAAGGATSTTAAASGGGAASSGASSAGNSTTTNVAASGK